MRFVFSYSFVWVIVVCGFVILGFMIGNLAILGLHRHPTQPYNYFEGANHEVGRILLVETGCIGCHVIPGIVEAEGKVGPVLDRIQQQNYIAGVLVNTPENLIEWIANPQAHSPGNAMPDLGVSEEQARDMAAYLYKVSRDR